MKKQELFSLFIIILLIGLLFSCGQEEKGTMEEVKEETQAALDTASQWTQEQAQKIVQDLQTAVENINEDLKDLRADPPEEADIRSEWDKSIEQINRSIDQVEEQLSRLKDKSGEEWEKIKTDIDKTLKQIQQEIDKLKNEQP